MRYSVIALIGVMTITTSMSLWAGYRGWWLPTPERSPPSIREGSVRSTQGKMRTRYFVGGGFRGGK